MAVPPETKGWAAILQQQKGTGMRVRRSLAIVGLVGAVAAVAVAGTAMAQTPTPGANQAKTNYQNLFMDKLAAALGVGRDKLNSAFTDARNATVDQEVRDGKLTQQQADRIKANPNVGPGFGFGFRGSERERGEKGAFSMGGIKVWSAIAGALETTPQDLTNQLRSGKTLAQLAQGKEQAVKDAIVNTVKPKLDQAVKNGRMTQDQENQFIDKIQKSDLNNFGGHWGMKGPRKGNNATPTPNSPSSFFRQAPAAGGAL